MAVTVKHPDFKGMSVVLTGKGPGDRKFLEHLLFSEGARVQSTVSGKTDILIVEDSRSSVSKVVRAKDLGVRLMAYEEAFDVPVSVKISEAQKQAARDRIDAIQAQIDELWKECALIADENRVTFSYEGPDGYGSGGQYYPSKPSDWIDGDYDSEENKDHPEYEEYHPWNGDFTWEEGEGNWISSSSRC